VMQYARNCHRKPLLSLFLYVFVSCIVRMHNQSPVTSISMSSNERISVRIFRIW
jgi:hypothetical protein